MVDDRESESPVDGTDSSQDDWKSNDDLKNPILEEYDTGSEEDNE